MSGTGIAGAQDHLPAQDASIRYVCGKETELFYSARCVPGVGFRLACSQACRDDPRFSFAVPTHDRLCALGALAAAMTTYLASHELSGPLPDDAPVVATIDGMGGRGVIVTAGMIRRAADV
jgi:hypothetical protein